MEEEQESRPQVLQSHSHAEGEKPQSPLQLLFYNCQRWVSDDER